MSGTIFFFYHRLSQYSACIDYERGVPVPADRYYVGRVFIYGSKSASCGGNNDRDHGEKIGGNVNILLFLAFLGIVVALITKSGASKAYGEWASHAIRHEEGRAVCKPCSSEC